MAIPFDELCGLGIALEGSLLWRLFKHRQTGRYPYFTGFVIYDLARTLLLVGVSHFGRDRFATTYWYTEGIALVLLFAIIWDVARYLFPAESALRRIASKAVISTEVMLAPTLLFLAWAWTRSNFDQYPVLGLWSVIEQYFTVAVSLLLLIIAGVARYYGVSLGRNMRGLIGGFGVYLTLYAGNYAALQIVPRFHAIWQLLSSVTYLAMTTCWVWAFWQYAPPPVPAPVPPRYLTECKQQWQRLRSTTAGILKRGLE